MDEDDDGFNLIQPSLIQQLKTILDQYPDDGQILKELIQNAEDAGATQVKFLHDLHSYGTEKLHSEGLGQFQGPALYAYNNAEFTKEDWKGIRMLCDSIKVKDPMKVGRFGLGFKSVFHVTDLPSILSGSQIGVIDPHEEYFTERKIRRTGYSWKITDDRHIINNIPDQFAPYKGIFDCANDVFSRGWYNGTLFRFPLRHRPSDLSQTLYSAEKVHTLFEGFMADAHLILLFLQHLESVELYVRGEYDAKPRKTFQVRITDDSLHLVREKRKEFHNKISTGSLLPHPVQVTYPITVETVHFSQGSETTQSHSFLVTNYFCGEEMSSEFQTLAKDQSLSYLPLVGVAMALPASFRECTPKIQGHVFCFLPLPVQKTSLTGLPVHVNGFFALSQNRRYIKSPNAEQESQELTDKSLLWNRCLLEEALPRAYASMLLEAVNEKSYNIQEETVYRAWPNIDAIDQKWKRLQNPLLKILCSANIVYTKASGGKWLKVEDAILDRLGEHQPKELLVSVLLEAHQNVATLPDYVLKAFITVRNNPVIKEITPLLVRQILKESPSSYRNLARMEKLNLLSFILNCIDESFADLIGLELLPVSSGTFKYFASFSNCDEAVYVCSPDHPRKMFPCLDHQFLDQDLDGNLLEMMEKVAKKGCTQLKFLRQDDVASLLSKSLPPEWSQGEAIFWYHGSDYHKHPGLGWLELVWNYFRTYFTTNDGLCEFTGLPLIPQDMSQVPISLSRLQQPSKIVVKSLLGEFLDETLIQSLKLLGLIIIQQCPSYLTLHPAVVNAFIYPPSPHGVLKALSACLSVVRSNKHSLTDEGKRSLRKFFSKESSLEIQAKHLLRTLPLFETLNNCFVSGEEDLCAAPPEGSYPVSPRQDLIDVTHDDSKRLAYLLGIRCLSPIEFFLEVLFPDVKVGHYSDEEMDRLMGFVMERFQVYAGADPRFEAAMKSLPFVPSKNRRVRAMDLFDPGIELLKRMLTEEDLFPDGEQYTNPAALVVLKKLGMKSEKEISAEDLYRSATKISQMSNLEAAKQKSEAILSYLESNSTKLQQTVSGVTLTQHLRDVQWVSVVKERPLGAPISLYSIEKTSKVHFYKPTEVTSEDKVNLVGTVTPIVRVNSSSQLAKYFGWDKMPDSLDVVQHLKTVVTHYTPDEKHYYISIVKDIYSYLNQFSDPEVIKEALQRIENSSWIWNGDGFSSPDVVLAVRPSVDLTPYICSLPSEVIQFSNLFSKFGMREHCDALSFVQVLHQIKQKYECGNKYPNTEVKRDLQLSADILNEIKPKEGEQLPTEVQEKVLIPTHVEGDSYVRLAPVKDCMYCDHEWLDHDAPSADEKDCFFVHRNIPNSTSELLQVPTLRYRLLEADEIGDEFGQEEKLTRRLNRLLEEYTDGLSVPKELIQNADDAGATEVRFLYDERKNEDAMTCLIDERMRDCQGPAFWVYNDAKFMDEDFANIVNLNGGTKEYETEKIGKFGLGFNTVYNLTDVPMLLSRNYFVILDPNKFYLGKRGIIIDVNKNPEKKRKFKNQFKPFNNIFGCDLHLKKQDNSFQGTLFRFPLRSKEQAVSSEIKKIHYDNNQMRELLEMFVCRAKTLLLFTQNVRQVSIFHLPVDCMEPLQPKLVFQTTKALSQAGIIRELSFPMTLPSHLQNLSRDDQYLLKQSRFLRASSEVAKHTGDTQGTGNDLLRSAFTINLTSSVTECGRLLFDNDDESSVESTTDVWFVASSMGKGQAMQYSLNDRSLLPAAAVAVQLITQENGKFAPKPIVCQATGDKSRHNGTVFCFLPLPVHSGLPVHINGAFAVASSRRHLKQKTEDDKACVGVEWNDVLFTDSVCAAYLDLLEDVKPAAAMYSFYSLWPKACDMEPCCEPLARSFYLQVTGGGYSLFSDGKRWVDINQVVCLEPYFRQDRDVGDISYAVLKMLVSEDKVVVDLPVDIFQSFVKYDLEEQIRLRTYEKGRFFRELFFPNIASIAPDMRDRLVLYALDDAKGEFDELIRTYACIPASPIGKTLKCPSELVNPNKAAASVFQAEDERFPFGTDATFLDCVRLAKLEQLGMVADDAPWGMFEERAKSVGILNEESSKAALERAKALICLLERKLYPGAEGEVPEGFKENLLQIKFLPVSTKPEKFPLFWKGGDLRPEKSAKLVSPEEAFVESTMYLVCCSEPLVDGNIYISSTVKKFLQLDKKATVKHIITQLDVASCANDDLNSMQFEQVKTTCLKAYKYLQAALNENQIDENEVRGLFQEKKFILAGREFVDTKHVAFELPVDCCPYLHKLPEDLAKQFRNLMRSVGVKQVYEANDFLSSLEQIKRSFGDTVLEKEILQAAVHLACQLGTCVRDCGVSDGKQNIIYLPDSQGIMRPVSKLCIKDCLWIPEEKDVYYAESMIPHPICLKLGVKTRRAEALSRFAVGIPFGQKEKLTNRLQRLLQAYPCEKEILKELLQNADDAEATEICFIKDPRQHPVERVFEDSWKPLQGPALCVYNNKPFTEADIKGIQNLGEGSKGDDPNKTGQYGVGFNAVYHLTDVPSFASCGDEIGDVLCVFDPNCKYVPGATHWEPGRMFRETTKLRGNFPDVFSCYNEEHFSLRNATMFRFPLRTEEMAKDSEISNSPVTLEILEGMMESLKTELFEVLLFVNSVRKITVCDIDDHGQKVNSYFVKAEMSEEDALKRQTFASYVKQIGRSFKQHPERSPIQAEVKKCSYVLTLKDSMENEEKWLIVQQIGFENHVKESIIDAYKRNDLGMLPRGGVACLLERKSALVQRTEEKNKVYCFLPLPIQTDLPLHINGHFALDHEARRSLYSAGGYRTEWNNFLMSDVIASCYLTLLDKVRCFYNLPVSQSPQEISLSCCKDELTKNIKEYEKLFPSAISSNQYWATLVTSVYQGMDYKRVRLVPVLRGDTTNGSTPNSQLSWLPLTGDGEEQAFFNNLAECDCFTPNVRRAFDENEKKRKVKEKALFENILLKTGFNLVALSVFVCKAAQECGVQTSFVSPSAVMEFYKSFSDEIPLCSIGSLFVDVRDTPFKSVQTVVTVLKYCKESDRFLGNLPGLPLLVTQDNHLQPFNVANRKYLSRHHHILPQCKEMFVHDHIRTHIFGDVESLDASVFKHFDVGCFAATLHRALPHEYLNSSQYVKWNPKQVAEPNGDWVYRVWRFLDEQVENVLREEKKKENEMENGIQATQTSVPEVKQSREKKETRIIRTVLEPLSKISILPCTETTPLPKSSDGNASGVVADQYLVPLSLAESVLDFKSLDTTSKFLVEALRKLSLPELNRAVLSSTGTSVHTSINPSGLARRLVATINSPKFLLLALCQKIARNPNCLHGKLNSGECRTILEHFSNSVTDLGEGDKLALKKLPLYETTYGVRVSLENKSVCVVPVEVPHDGMDVLGNDSDVIFLKSCFSLSPLYQFLEFESVSLVDIYCNYIFESFSLFSSQARQVHLEYIRDTILKQRSTKKTEKKRLLYCLANTGIIASRDGTLLQASCYFDPKHVVFKTMLSEDMFPPKPFDDEWLPFLRSIGLVHEVSQDLFKRFAMEVAREGSTTHTDKTDKKSELLVTHLYSREDVVQEGLLRAILDIRFVVPAHLKPELREICPPYGSGDIGHTPYIPFRGSVPARHAEIVWTTAAILPKWANPKRHVGEMNATGWKSKTDYCNAIIANLKILEEPTVEQVTFHCQNVSFQMEKENESDLVPELVASRMSVMRNIYQFLEGRAILTTFTKERLRHTPCVVVEDGKRVVKALQVVIELDKNLEIRPFLYSLPGELCQFKIFFQYLGCAPSVKPCHFAMVLEMLQDNCKKNRLEPNEIEKALKAEKSIFEALEDYPEGLQDLSSLYLPAMRPFVERLEGTALSIFLCDASELLFDDAPYYHDRLRCFEHLFVVDLKKANVRCSPCHIYKDLIMLLPHAARPQLLSHAVEEKFVNSRSKTAIFDVGAASIMKKTLHSEQFSRGIIRLIRHACHKHQVEVDESVVTMIEGRLKTTEIHGVSRIETNLVHDGKVITGSEMEVPFYLEKVCRSGEENWSLYVNVADDVEETLSTIAMVLADVIAEACNGLLRETAMFIPEMLQSQPGKISSLLDKRKIRPDDAYDSKKGDVYPQPGDFIPIEDHHLLNPEFGTFYPGEYVGYEVEDPSLHLEDGDATYIYAVIIEEICPDIDTDTSFFCRNYRINIGSDKTPVVQATELYKFYRPPEVISTAVALTDQQDSTHAPNEKQHIFHKITEVLEEAWKLPNDKRRQVVKRLFLQWHPDKNPGNEEFCTEVFLFIKSEIERLEKLEGARRRESGSSESFDHSASYGAYFGFWGTRARHYSSRRQTYQETYYQHYGSRDPGTRTWEVPPSFCTTNPQPRQAKRWFRQAEADLKAVVNDMNSVNPSYEWACLKCHQAAEKALKAAQYAVDAFKTNVHNLIQNSLMLADSCLITLSGELENLVGDSTCMRYPDRLDFPKIPNDVYKERDARQAEKVAREIVEKVRSRVF